MANQIVTLKNLTEKRLTLDGSCVISTIANFSDPSKITFTSSSNNSSIVFTVVGTNSNDKPQIELINGPNNNTVTGTKFFKTVTSIKISENSNGKVSVGNV